MPDDFYTGDEASESRTGEGMEGGEQSERSDSGMETTLVPKSMFERKELKPGDEFYFTVVRVHDNEVEVEYKHDEGKEKAGEEAGSDTPETAFDSKFSMMGAGGAGSGGKY